MNRETSALLIATCVCITTCAVATPAMCDHRFLANQQQKLCIFDKSGNLEWSMQIEAGPHDIHLLPNGNILTHQKTELIEIDPRQKELVWKFDVRELTTAPKVEVHALMAISQEMLMVAVSGEGAILEIDRDGKVHHRIKMHIDYPHPHRDTRLVRRLQNGNYLVAHEGDGAVREYDRNGNVTWEFEVPLFGKEKKRGHGPEAFGNSVFSALRLKNGNTLVGTGNGHSVLEVTPDKKIVWKLEQNDLPGITLAWVTTLEVHENENIIIGNCHAGPDNPQLIEINRDKNIVWQFQDHKNLGNAVSNSQILDAKGAVIR